MNTISNERLQRLSSRLNKFIVENEIPLSDELGKIVDDTLLASNELLALRKEREAAVPVAESDYVRREVHVGGNTWVQCSAQAYERAKAEGKITRELYERPAVPVAVPEWTNDECFEFLSIAFRHAEIKGDFELDDLRLGVKMVNESRAAMLQSGNDEIGSWSNPKNTPTDKPKSEMSQQAEQLLRNTTALAATLRAETDTTSQQFESLVGKSVVPVGWKLMPIEPTVEMQIAFAETWFSKVRCVDDCELEDAYIAMLAAAPEPCK